MVHTKKARPNLDDVKCLDATQKSTLRKNIEAVGDELLLESTSNPAELIIQETETRELKLIAKRKNPRKTLTPLEKIDRLNVHAEIKETLKARQAKGELTASAITVISSANKSLALSRLRLEQQQSALEEIIVNQTHSKRVNDAEVAHYAIANGDADSSMINVWYTEIVRILAKAVLWLRNGENAMDQLTDDQMQILKQLLSDICYYKDKISRS